MKQVEKADKSAALWTVCSQRFPVWAFYHQGFLIFRQTKSITDCNSFSVSKCIRHIKDRESNVSQREDLITILLCVLLLSRGFGQCFGHCTDTEEVSVMARWVYHQNWMWKYSKKKRKVLNGDWRQSDFYMWCLPLHWAILEPLQERHWATLFGQCCKSRRDGWNRRDQEIWSKSQQESIIWTKNRFIKGMDFKAHQKTFEAHWYPVASI